MLVGESQPGMIEQAMQLKDEIQKTRELRYNRDKRPMGVVPKINEL
jgi:hypothetical protein